MSKDFVGAEHEFHSKEFAVGWAERFVPTPERIRLFELIFSQLHEQIPPEGKIVELGMGPGYLAEYLLERLPGVDYCGIDFSLPMLDLARRRLRACSSRTSFLQADLVKDAWEEGVSGPVDAVISTWALHDLGSPENVATVYSRSYRALVDPGLLVNGDFIKPEGARQRFEGGRFPVNEHIELLTEAGFKDACCLSLFEEEVESPTPAQNYACIRAVK